MANKRLGSAEVVPDENLFDALVIEDDLDNQELMKRILSAARIHAVIVGDAQEALQVLRGFNPDIMIVDLALPGMNGVEFLEQVRQDPVIARIPAIAVTAFSKEFHTEEVKASGLIDAYMEKPIDALGFSQRVQRYVKINFIRDRLHPCVLCGRSSDPLYDVVTSGEVAAVFSDILSDSVVRRAIYDKRVEAVSSGRAWLLRYIEIAARWGNNTLPPFHYWEGSATTIPCPICNRLGDPLHEIVAVTDPCIVGEGGDFVKQVRAAAVQRMIPSRKSGGTWLIRRTSLDTLR